eukprot:scaffold6904_cov38-Phaeocystis_antarctica.AAC.2
MQTASRGTFEYDHCKFKVEPGKCGSARVVVALELKVALSYTIEASYAGPASGPHVDTHFSTRQLCAQGELLHPLTTPHPLPCYQYTPLPRHTPH